MRKVIPVSIALALLTGTVHAQSNALGIVQLGFAFAGGAYATEYEHTFLGETDSETDGAVSISFPLEVHVGLMRPLSLGLYLQPGSYLDSSATRTNGFFIGGLAPRFYAINNDRFNLWVGFEAGLATLVIKDTYTDELGDEDDLQYTFAGGHFRLATGINAYFGKTFGLQAALKYAGYNLPLRDLEPEPAYLNTYDAKLKISGVEMDLGVVVKFGGS